MSQYLALLRGINVGGKNLIRMTDLKACFEERRYRKVVTYIQSGNVLFESGERSPARLVRQIEEMLAARFAYSASVVLRTREELQAIVDQAPQGFGARPEKYRYDVIFLKPALASADLVGTVPARRGVDLAHAGPGALYFSRLVSKATQSQFGRIVSMPAYQSMTIRNWNTTTKLLRMMSEG
jgi:uncharacterized protein (DUF1697 family)